jgi:hypothetical protein
MPALLPRRRLLLCALVRNFSRLPFLFCTCLGPATQDARRRVSAHRRPPVRHNQ